MSGDVDVVGRRDLISPILRGWGFTAEKDPDRRVDWTRADLGLFVDIIHRERGHGRTGTPRRISTKLGPVWVSAAEDLILGRVVRWSRNGQTQMMDQAVELFVTSGGTLAADYLGAQVHYERVQEAYSELQRLARAVGPQAD